MTAIAEIVNALMDGGMDAAEATALVARVHAELSSKQPSKAAERTRKWREKNRHKPSQTVTKPSPAENVTERHKPSPVTERDGDIYTSSSFNLEIQKEGSKKDSVSRHANVTPSDWPSDFENQFWQKCPRRVARAAAMKALDKVRRSGLAWEKFDAGVTRWAAEAAQSDPKFVKHPATWLNAGCWDDEPAKSNGGNFETRGSIAAAAGRLAEQGFTLAPRPSIFGPGERRLLPPQGSGDVRLLSKK